MRAQVAISNEPSGSFLGNCRTWARRGVATVRLGRPQFLLGGVGPYALGAVIAREAAGVLDWRRCVLGQIVVTSVQLMTHYSNDYFDYEADVANQSPTSWSGGSRILPAFELPRIVALYAALFWASSATCCMVVVLQILPNVIVWGLMVAMLLLAWGYSAPPLRLHSSGIGEATAAIVVAVLVPWFGSAIQVGELTLNVELAVLPLLLVQFAMLVVLSVPDRNGDMTVGKRTLAVRIGLSGAARVHQTALMASYLILPVLWRLGVPAAVMTGVLCTSPLALFQMSSVQRGAFYAPERWKRMTFTSVALVFLVAVSEVLGFLL